MGHRIRFYQRKEKTNQKSVFTKHVGTLSKNQKIVKKQIKRNKECKCKSVLPNYLAIASYIHFLI